MRRDEGRQEVLPVELSFNDDIAGGVKQVDLSRQYGYAKQRVSEVVFIYPRLKNAEVLHVGLLSNHDLVRLARVACDEFRYACPKSCLSCFRKRSAWKVLGSLVL